MKAAKSLAAILLALCMMVSLPFAVSAADPFVIERVVEAPHNLDLSTITYYGTGLVPDATTTRNTFMGKVLLIEFSTVPDEVFLANLANGLYATVGPRIFVSGTNLAEKETGLLLIGRLTQERNVLAFTYAGGWTSFDQMRTDNGLTDIKVKIRLGGVLKSGETDKFKDENGTNLTLDAVNLTDGPGYDVEHFGSTPLICEDVSLMPDDFATQDLDKGRIWLLRFNKNMSASSTPVVKMTVYDTNGNVVSGNTSNLTCNVVPAYSSGNVLAIGSGYARRMEYFKSEAETNGVTLDHCQITIYDEVSNNSFVDTLLSEDGQSYYTTAKVNTTRDALIVTCDINESHVAAIGDEKYASAAEALLEAGENETVKLLQNDTIADAVCILDAGVTLDLNGKYLTVNSLLAFGDVVDSFDGYGKLVVGADNVYDMDATDTVMPLYDTDGYRFYNYEFHLVDKNIEDADKVQYSVRLGYTNKAAYAVLANDDNMTFGLEMTINKADGESIKYTWAFSDNLMNEFAKLNATSRTAITATISGMGNLDDADYSTQAILKSENLVVNLTKDPTVA